MTETGAQEGNANVPEPRPPVILHLSDLHFRKGEDLSQTADRQKVLDGLLAFVGDLDEEWRPSIVCVSGDIGGRESGARPDYDAAGKWLRELLSVLGIGAERLVLCPGNHDVDRAQAGSRPSDVKPADDEFLNGEPHGYSGETDQSFRRKVITHSGTAQSLAWVGAKRRG